MTNDQLQGLVECYNRGEISRRSFVRRVTGMGISAALATSLIGGARAQGSEATPEASPAASPAATPVAGGEAFRSITRDEYYAEVAETFGFEAIGTAGGDFIYAYTADVASMNPTLGQDVYSAYITNNVFNALVQTSVIDGSIVPDLADSWERAADGITYTFYLNPNARFHDGTPVTSADVAFSFDSIVDETSISPRSSDVNSVVQSYRIVDDHTFEITAVAPLANFLDKGPNFVAIVPKHVWEAVPFGDWETDPGNTGVDPARVIGSGPFRFVERVQGDHVTLEKVADFWDPARQATIDRYIYRVIPESNALIQALVADEIGAAEASPQQSEDLTANNPDILVNAYDTPNFTFYSANLDSARTTFFQDVRVRQAMLIGLDRSLATEQILLGYGIRADGTQPVLSRAYAPDQVNTLYEYDPQRAAALLEEAGWVDTDGDGIREKDGQKFSFELLYSEGEPIYIQLLPYMQQAWGEIGIECAPTVKPFQTVVEEFTTGVYDVCVIGFSWNIDGDQGSMFNSRSVPPNGFNCNKYVNEEYDRLNAEQGLALDPDVRRQLLIDQSNIINDEQAVGILFFPKQMQASRLTVHNFLPNGYNPMWSLPWVWVDA